VDYATSPGVNMKKDEQMYYLDKCMADRGRPKVATKL